MCMHIQLTQARTEAKLGARLDLVGNCERAIRTETHVQH